MNGEIVRGELRKLPRRAIVAFAVRSAKRVRPLANGLPAQKQMLIDQVIEAADSYTRGIVENEGVLRSLVAIAENESRGITPQNASVAEVAAFVAFQVAETLGFAIEEALDTRLVSEPAVVAALIAARVSDTGGNTPASAAAEHDLRVLLQSEPGEPGSLGRPIDPSELGPLWPNGSPDWYTAPNEPANDSELIFEIEIPEEATDDDVLNFVSELVLQADTLHRAYGGHGLKVETLEVHQAVGVLEGGPRG